MQKQNRLKLLRILLETRELHTREEILEEMNSNGAEMQMYQLMSDMNDLQAVKIPTFHGQPVWKLPDKGNAKPEAYINSANLSEQIKTVDTAGNLIVVHTFPAMAQSVATALDDAKDPEITGTIAGYDTVLVVTPETETATRIADKIRSIVCA